MKNGWQKKRLGDICDFEGGSQPPKSEFIYEEKPGYVRFLQIRDFGSDKNITYIRQAKKNRLCGKSDILIGRYGASVGKILTGLAGAYNVALMKTIPNLNIIDKTWFYHFLVSDAFQLPLLNIAKRSAQAGFSKDDIYNFSVPVPPLIEQKRIVQKLDEAFAGIAKAKENVEKNLQNARALFESHLEAVFTQRGPGWVDKKLEEVCGFQNGFAFKSNTFKTTGAPIIRISNIQEGRIDTENRLVFFNPKDYGENLDRYRIVKGDLLIAMSGATTGKLGFNTEDTTFYLNQRVGKFEPGKHLDKRYLYYFLSTRVEENLRISAGAAQPNLSTEQIKGFVIPLPPINEQKRIVERLDNLADQAQRLARLYDHKLEALESLKKSILHEAFSGNL